MIQKSKLLFTILSNMIFLSSVESANIQLCRNQCGGNACRTLDMARMCLTQHCVGLEGNSLVTNAISECKAAASTAGFYDPKSNQFGVFSAGQGGQGGGADPAEVARLQAKLQKAKQEKAQFLQQLSVLQTELARLKAAGGGAMPASDPTVEAAFNDFTSTYDASSNKVRVDKFKEVMQKIETYGDFPKGVELYTFVLNKYENLDLSKPENDDEASALANFMEKIRDSKDDSVKAAIAKIEKEKAEINYQQRHQADKVAYDAVMRNIDVEIGAPSNLNLRSDLVYPDHRNMKILLLFLKLQPLELEKFINKSLPANDWRRFSDRSLFDSLTREQAMALRWFFEDVTHGKKGLESRIADLLVSLSTRAASNAPATELDANQMLAINKQLLGVFRSSLAVARGGQASARSDQASAGSGGGAGGGGGDRGAGGGDKGGTQGMGPQKPPYTGPDVFGTFNVANPPYNAPFELRDAKDAFVNAALNRIIGELNRARRGGGATQAFELIPLGPRATAVLATYIRQNPAARPIYAKIVETQQIPNDAQRFEFQMANIAPEIDALYSKNPIVARGGAGGAGGAPTNKFFDQSLDAKNRGIPTVGIQTRAVKIIKSLNDQPKRADPNAKIPLKGDDFNRVVNYLVDNNIAPEDSENAIDQAFTSR